MLFTSVLAVSLSFMGQVPADAGGQLPPHKNQEIVVKVVDAKTGAVVGNASLEWVDLSTDRVIPAETTTGDNGLAILALQGRRYMLRARLPDGRQSRPEPVPGHEIVLKLIVPPPQPAATALQPIPGTGCDEFALRYVGRYGRRVCAMAWNMGRAGLSAKCDAHLLIVTAVAVLRVIAGVFPRTACAITTVRPIGCILTPARRD